jgi:hypothetical protein
MGDIVAVAVAVGVDVTPVLLTTSCSCCEASDAVAKNARVKDLRSMVTSFGSNRY